MAVKYRRFACMEARDGVGNGCRRAKNRTPWPLANRIMLPLFIQVTIGSIVGRIVHGAFLSSLSPASGN